MVKMVDWPWRCVDWVTMTTTHLISDWLNDKSQISEGRLKHEKPHQSRTQVLTSGLSLPWSIREPICGRPAAAGSSWGSIELFHFAPLWRFCSYSPGRSPGSYWSFRTEQRTNKRWPTKLWRPCSSFLCSQQLWTSATRTWHGKPELQRWAGSSDPR